ncbi:class I SAM-dependent methyltransferase [Sulfitobacter sp. JB4-11]|uniref:class I SAM-dependent methyltransferase n=1 Tax=Sulfitobacter rhodophyticola TaxID=3238304 RepID=UPI003D81648A
MKIARFIKWSYRTLVPASVRQTDMARRIKSAIVPHQILYDDTYYAESVDTGAVKAAGPISRFVVENMNPRTVIDVGCGTGAIAVGFREAGCRVVGLEYSTVGLQYCRERGLDVQKFDLENDHYQDLGLEKFDLVVSTEVAEHLPPALADRYADILSGLSDRIFMTAAVPGQGGVDHVNEQPHSYWIEKFEHRGFSYNDTLSETARHELGSKSDVAKWYSQNIMIFENTKAIQSDAI